jgi:multidrug efflux pump
VIGAFILLYALGFSVNVLTLLALILAIGMLVDDAIVVGENVFRYSEQGKPRLLAADLGAGEVAFAVVATTTVLLAVIAPLGFLTGDAGRLLGELAAGLGGALAFSSLVALTASVTVASKLVDAERIRASGFHARVHGLFDTLADGYQRLLRVVLKPRPTRSWSARGRKTALPPRICQGCNYAPGTAGWCRCRVSSRPNSSAAPPSAGGSTGCRP